MTEVKVDKVQVSGAGNTTFAVCLDQDEKKILQSVTRCAATHTHRKRYKPNVSGKKWYTTNHFTFPIKQMIPMHYFFMKEVLLDNVIIIIIISLDNRCKHNYNLISSHNKDAQDRLAIFGCTLCMSFTPNQRLLQPQLGFFSMHICIINSQPLQVWLFI